MTLNNADIHQKPISSPVMKSVATKLASVSKMLRMVSPLISHPTGLPVQEQRVFEEAVSQCRELLSDASKELYEDRYGPLQERLAVKKA